MHSRVNTLFKKHKAGPYLGVLLGSTCAIATVKFDKLTYKQVYGLDVKVSIKGIL